MAGRSPEMLRLFNQMRHIAAHLRIATIEGECGTGRMLAAQSLHQFGSAPESPFVLCPSVQLCDTAQGLALVPSRDSLKRDLPAIPDIRKSAYGTLVITRVDELTLAQQTRFVELLQWIDYQHMLHNLDAIPRRIICLSTKPLRRLAVTAALRTDLANRLTAVRFALPPLRERREDIPLLADLFAARFSATHGKPIRGIDPPAYSPLVEHTWPGNIRELESVIQAATLACPGQWIRRIDLPALKAAAAPAPTAHPSPDNDPNLDRAIMRHIQRVLARAEGNKLRAAKLLGISRSTLYRLLDNAATQKAS
ncbi:MAG TPA: sigma 54-interacting transcriptional regulator [Acidobacteriaceae bacterium]|nr:sigma 54-interacting transcriptional regulator [Acidobacteriaceae bacterium]